MEKLELPKHPWFVNLSGMTFGKLTVVKYNGLNKERKSLWVCECTCGRTAIRMAAVLKRSTTPSCGCDLEENIRQRSLIHGHNTADYTSSEYTIWNNIKARCFNKNNKQYPGWGGRGIVMCDKWRSSFADFIKDVGLRPSPKHSLDRFPDNNGNYEPGNTRWATAKEQNSNTRRNKWIEYNGNKMILTDWARHFKMNPRLLSKYLIDGLTFEQCIVKLSNRYQMK